MTAEDVCTDVVYYSLYSEVDAVDTRTLVFSGQSVDKGKQRETL